MLWVERQADKDSVDSLSRSLAVSPTLSRLLNLRGIELSEKAFEFLEPKLAHLASPFDIPHLRDAVVRIIKSIECQEGILLVGDYDVDGMTSTAMMVSALKKLGATVYYYIPNRFTDGYGLSTSIIPLIQQENIGLLLTLDCGISNSKEIAEIKQQCKIKVGIFDHHKISDLFLF